uniref:L-type lectin-like domain-containing protein n=1 Tax=Bursaphelenchus xylophilus TaxID=6326 RepID=A0A1I7RYB1_BURXY
MARCQASTLFFVLANKKPSFGTLNILVKAPSRYDIRFSSYDKTSHVTVTQSTPRDDTVVAWRTTKWSSKMDDSPFLLLIIFIPFFSLISGNFYVAECK